MFNKDQGELAQLRSIVNEYPQLGPVVVANADLRYGMTLDPEQVRVVQWPVDSRPANVFTSMEELFGPEGTKPRAIIRIIEPGEAIMATKVTEFGQDAGVASRLSKGMRAFAIRVDVQSGVSGFLQPSDRIDIFWNGNDQGRSFSKLVLENVSIIAVDQIADEQANRPLVARTVTVEVSPADVATLVQAQASGKLSLSLRGTEDIATSETSIEVDQAALTGRVEEVIQPVIEVEKCTIKVRKGSEVVEEPC
jgi:pilus assembly protein CpaB